LTIVLINLFTVHLYLACYFNLLLYISFIVWSHDICTCTFPFILTHSLGVLTRWICISRSMYIILLIRYLERITPYRSQSSRCLILQFRYLFLFFIPVAFMILYIAFSTCFIPLFFCYHVWTSICVIAVILIHHSDYIACSGYFRLSSVDGVFSSRIYVVDSRRDSVSTYFGKRGVTFSIRN